MDDYSLSIEEVFFERHFEYGDDYEIHLSNYKTALNLYFKAYKESCLYAEKISDGEVVDEPTVVFNLQNLILSHKYATIFKKALGDERNIMDLKEINTDGIKDISNMSKFLTEAEENRDYSKLEKALFLVFVANQ